MPLPGYRPITPAEFRRFSFLNGFMTSVQDSVERCLENVRSALQRAIDTLQMVAQKLGRSDVPAHDDVEILLRGVPRFELAMNPRRD